MTYLQQPLLNLPNRSAALQAVVDYLSEADIEVRGAVFTRLEVVTFILDLVGYTVDKDLARMRLLEPACGAGEFLLAAVERLLDSFESHNGDLATQAISLQRAILAVELHRNTYETLRQQLIDILISRHVVAEDAELLASTWLVQDDFLLTEIQTGFDVIVGNPPYVRQELIPELLLLEYRQRYHTIFDRADLYIPFIERSLELLASAGSLAFICSDRWMKNRYGGPLRALIARDYHLKFHIDMTDTDAFYSAVMAYPAITVINKGQGTITRVARQPQINAEALHTLRLALQQDDGDTTDLVQTLTTVTRGDKPWVLDASAFELDLLRRLETSLPSLEAVDCKVGIGVATGCDRVYIGQLQALPVEDERKLPLIMAPDLRTGDIQWSGKGIINPFAASGDVVDLAAYPQFGAYIKEHEAIIRNRNVARQNARAWYRTIDRIYPELTYQPKLLIPDIKSEPHVVYDSGQFYPHHNLYVVTSTTWDLRALQTVLQSSIAKLFVSLYSVKMRGGYFRFQAQYLRRIPLPAWHTVPDELRARLRQAAEQNDRKLGELAVFDLYQLSDAERELLTPALG